MVKEHESLPLRMSARGLLRFLLFRFALNLKSAYSFRVSFWSQIFFMAANNGFLLWFWSLFFQRFGGELTARGGWGAQDLYALYGVTAVAFGLAHLFAGSAVELAGLVADGELDYFLSHPVPTLFHALVIRTRVSAIGDVVFGMGLLAALFHRNLADVLVALAVCVPGALVYVSVAVIGAASAFWLGESRGITGQLVHLLTTFGTYPEAVFQGSVRWVIYGIVPAAFFSHLPVSYLRLFSAGRGFTPESLRILGLLLGGAVLLLALAVGLFQRGLRRYESGGGLALRS